MTKPWYWRSLPLENRTGSDVFAALFRHTSTPGIATLLESPYPTPKDNPQLSRYSICAGAPRIVDGALQMWTPPLGQVLPFLEQLLQGRGREQGAGSREQGEQGEQGEKRRIIPTPHSPLPFTGGWLGWLGYDVAWEIEQLPRWKSDSLPFPVAFWYEPECFAILDHAQQVLWLATSDEPKLDALESQLSVVSCQNNSLPGFPSPTPPLPQFLTSQEDYETAVNQAKKYILAGDIFQANISLRFAVPTEACGWDIYRALQQINPSPFASYWQTPWGEVISCSPERLVQMQRGSDAKFHVSTRPIAGTRSRGATPEQDLQLAQDLLTNPKERAEHIMLVDLERNDLGRVCEWGSVAVDELLTIERYSHVMHLVSNIKGTLRSDRPEGSGLKPNRNAIDLIRAMFPGGTITGCPKVRCMEILEQLEPVRRSLFYGSCGYLDCRGNLDLNILIRTLLLTPSPSEAQKSKGVKDKAIQNSALNTIWGQVGAGIVADSDPEREWYESLHKAQAQLAALATVLSPESKC